MGVYQLNAYVESRGTKSGSTCEIEEAIIRSQELSVQKLNQSLLNTRYYTLVLTEIGYIPVVRPSDAPHLVFLGRCEEKMVEGHKLIPTHSAEHRRPNGQKVAVHERVEFF